MRRVLHALTIVLVTVGLVGVAAPAQATTKPGVKISKSIVAKPAFAASTVVKPKYVKGVRTKIVSARVTVRGTAQSGRRVNVSGASVRVAAGTYKVTTKVVFKTKKTKKTKKWSARKAKSATYTHRITQGPKNCATMSDYDAIRVGDDFTFGSFKPEVERLMAHVGTGDGSVLLEDMYWYFYYQGDYELADFVAGMQEVYGEDASTEIVTYEMCASTKRIEVFYVNYTRNDNVRVDEVIDKEIV